MCRTDGQVLSFALLYKIRFQRPVTVTVWLPNIKTIHPRENLSHWSTLYSSIQGITLYQTVHQLTILDFETGCIYHQCLWLFCHKWPVSWIISFVELNLVCLGSSLVIFGNNAIVLYDMLLYINTLKAISDVMSTVVTTEGWYELQYLMIMEWVVSKHCNQINYSCLMLVLL